MSNHIILHLLLTTVYFLEPVVLFLFTLFLFLIGVSSLLSDCVAVLESRSAMVNNPVEMDIRS